MANYVDVYLLPIAEENIDQYRSMAEDAGRIFRKHGALSYREYIASDLSVPDEVAAFPAVMGLKPGETVIYAAVEFESEEQRNTAMAAIFKDPELGAGAPEKSVFDSKRMAYGGFKLLVDV